jgi:hypothetical protein
VMDTISSSMLTSYWSWNYLFLETVYFLQLSFWTLWDFIKEI